MKKLINDPYQFTMEEIEGYVAAFTKQVRQINNIQAVMRADAPIQNKVAVIIGGGSGHEPLFMGYLGKGLADGCPVGNVFTSPSVDIVYETTKAISGGAGVIYLYGNYSGDVMNFDMAAEMAEDDGISVQTVLVTDDVASAPKEEIEKRRGIAGDFFVFKAAGARAEEGASLDEVVAAARKANDNTRTMGVALSSCIIPASGKPIFQMGDDEIELGLGIHGEPGESRQKLIPADEVTEKMLERVLTDLPFQASDEVAVLVNGLGSTPLGELYIVFRRTAQLLADANIKIYRSYVGEYSTSLEMAGCSVTLMRLDDELKRLLDQPAYCPCFVQVD
jgi:phosphoenolpyruvate---glycerone phosphotransferase subunit DhaK